MLKNISNRKACRAASLVKAAQFITKAAIVALTVLIATPASAAEHPKDLGITLGYVSRNNSAFAGLVFQYRFSQAFRLSADAEVVFRNENRNAFLIDINAHFPFDLGRKWEAYPLVGFNSSSWSRHNINADSQGDGSTIDKRSTNFGLNAGGGVALRVSSTLKLSLEATFTAVKQNNTARVAALMTYTF